MQSSTEATIYALLEDLNEPQRQAATHTDGPLLILAGPGSGKTRVVTRRAAYLACTTTKPWHILAITFTNKAAREMRERVDALGGTGGMTVCTFHALCARLLREFHELAGISRNFTIFDRDDRRKLIKKAVEEADLSQANWPPAAIDAEISHAKNAMLSPEAYAATANDWRQQTISRIYPVYERLLAEMEALDFDDLLMRVAVLLKTDEQMRATLEDRYRYVLIDEYQDTNVSQYQIARHLSREHQNICATGDPDQSIYGWRGADIGNILNFERDYPSTKVVRLEQNYRSTRRVLSAADALIAQNENRKEKTLWTQNEAGTPVRVIESENDMAEAAMIAEDIGRLSREGVSLNDIAIFYRVNSLSRVLEEAMLKSVIPYQIARGVEFYARKEIKDVLAYLRLLVNPADEIALLRIINMPPRGIGAKTIERLVEQAKTSGQSVFDVLSQAGDVSDLGRSAAKVKAFAELVRHLGTAVNQPASKALEFVISHSGLRAHYRAIEGTDDAPINNIDELINAAAEFEMQEPGTTLVDWLEHTALVSDVDAVKDTSGVVTLMTLHAAKGLEFAHVYVIGLERGLLPFYRNGDEGDDEEERRLLFVGITRARKRLTLSRARYRMRRGVTERTAASDFLDELPRNELEWHRLEAPRARRGVTTHAGGLPNDFDRWDVGTLVRHPRYDLGRILSIDRGAQRTIVDVEFTDGLHRTWALEFAQLTRVDPDEIDDVDGFQAD